MSFFSILATFLAQESFAIPRSLSDATDTTRSSFSGNAAEVWKRTLALSLSQSSTTAKSPQTTNAMRSGPLAAVFRATLSTSSSSLCTAEDPVQKCEVALDGFGTIGQVFYTFNDYEKNRIGRSTQTVVACRCLSQNCTRAVLVRPVTIMTSDADGNLVDSGKSTCLYQAFENNFSECHRELFRVSYRDKDYGRRNALNLEESVAVEYSVADEHHGDFWSARGDRGTKLKCLESDINKLRRVNVSTISLDQNDSVEHPNDDSQASACVPPEGWQYFRGEEQSEEELCGEVFDNALFASRHIASQQDCFGVGKRELAFMNPASVSLISDTELALTCSSAVLGIMWLWSVLLKQVRIGTRPTRLSVLAVGVQMGLSYVLEALPLHTALSNEIKGRSWRSLIAFVDATTSEIGKETSNFIGKILVMTVVLGETEHLSTRVGLVAALTGVFDFVALVLGISIIWGMVRRYRRFSRSDQGKEDLQESGRVIGVMSGVKLRNPLKRSSPEEYKVTSASEASSESYTEEYVGITKNRGDA